MGQLGAQQALAIYIVWLIFAGTVVGTFALTVFFAMLEGVKLRELRKESQKCASACAMVYLLERLHGKRFTDTRSRIRECRHRSRRRS